MHPAHTRPARSIDRSDIAVIATTHDRLAEIALTAVQAALTDPEPRIREAALRALSEWPDVAACDALLKDKLMTLQWWEEDRATDGCYTIELDGAEPKAFSFCHRPDGVVLGVWKARLAALSADEG